MPRLYFKFFVIILFMLTRNEILDFLQSNKQVFEKRFHCKKIGLFGSFARNEQTEQSDIDLLVEYQTNVADFYENEVELKQYISNHFNRKVDVCAEKWIKPIFKPLVMKDVIYA